MPPCLMLKQPNPCHDSADTHPPTRGCDFALRSMQRRAKVGGMKRDGVGVVSRIARLSGEESRGGCFPDDGTAGTHL